MKSIAFVFGVFLAVPVAAEAQCATCKARSVTYAAPVTLTKATVSYTQVQATAVVTHRVGIRERHAQRVLDRMQGRHNSAVYVVQPQAQKEKK